MDGRSAEHPREPPECRTRRPTGQTCAGFRFLYDDGIVPDPEGIITAGHENKTARTVAIHEGEAINARALTAMFKQTIAINRAGGWHRLKAGG